MDQERRVAGILGAWQRSREEGSAPDPQEVIRLHPDLADALRAGFEIVRALERDRPRIDLLPGVSPSTLGPYRILRELGHGGMGTVYLAEVTAALPELEPGRPVALKVLRPSLAERSGFVDRFRREAQAGRAVRHENVVRTLRADTVERDGTTLHLLVMEFVEGRTLSGLLHEMGTVPEALVRAIGSQLARGLAAIHGKEIVHRDLKPENVIITADHEIRIMDLGVARLIEESVSLTKSGHFAGSFPYAAPEQFEGATVGPATDLYSLGVLLYELATGGNPFRGQDPISTMRSHLGLEPPFARDVNPEVSPFLSELLVTLLEKVAANRFAGADQVALILEEGEASSWWKDRESSGPRSAVRRPLVPVRRETRLHGRQEDLERLRSMFERAVAGAGQVVLVEGEAGIGKSRLVDSFLETIPPDFVHVLYGSYPPSGGLGGLSDALLEHFGAVALEAGILPYLPEAQSQVPAFAALAREESPPPGSPYLGAHALPRMFGQIVTNLAAEKTLVWVVEDLHFAEPEVRRILLTMARRAEECRAMLLLTTRPMVSSADLAEFGRLHSFHRRVLARLTQRDVVELLEDAFRSKALADRLGARIAEKSDGVPFFVFEMIRGLKEGQFITETPDGSFIETRDVERIEVPSAVRDLIVARLSDLGKDQRALLDAGAVAGYEIDPELMAHALDRPRVGVMQDLAEVERRSGVVRSAGAGWRFDHHQIQEVVYEEIPPALRREYHSMLVNAIAAREGIEGQDPGEIPRRTAWLVAHHHVRSREPEAAVRYLTIALLYLLEWDRHEAAVSLADTALALPGLLEGDHRADVLVAKTFSLGPLGRHSESRACIREASRLVNDETETQIRMRLLMVRSDDHQSRAEYAEAWTCYEGILDLAREIGQPYAEIRALTRMGRNLVGSGRPEVARDYFEDSLEKSMEIGDRLGEGESVDGLAVIALLQGDPCGAREHQERHRGVGLQYDHRNIEATVCARLGEIARFQGRFREALDSFESGISIFREIGYRPRETRAAPAHGRLLLALGRFGEARDLLIAGLELALELGQVQPEAEIRCALGETAEAEGNYDEAREDLEFAVRVFVEIGARVEEARSRLALGRVRISGGDVPGGAVDLDRALSLGLSIGLPGVVLLATVRMATLSHRTTEEALARLADLESRISVETGREARLALHRLTGDPAHLEEARHLFQHLLDHAQEKDRPAMMKSNPVP